MRGPPLVESGDARRPGSCSGAPFPASGELDSGLDHAPGLPLRGVVDCGYRGGVIKADDGVVEADFGSGSSPSRARCDGVKGISLRSSFGARTGRKASRMFNRKIKRSTKSGQPAYPQTGLKSVASHGLRPQEKERSG
jgi:hypothetical protein